MKSTVKKGTVDVSVKGKKTESPVRKKGFDYPDADAVASKYGVNESEEQAGMGDGGLSVEQQMKLAHQQQALVQKLETKNHEVERLCTLLEAVEPIPGMNPEKYRRIMENPDAGAVDFRDSKIVDLAKKCRNLQLSLSKERARNETLSTKVDKLSQINDSLEHDLDNTTSIMSSQLSGNASNRAIRASNSTFLSSGQEEKSVDSRQEKSAFQLSKELNSANKKVEDMRRKLQETEEENKKLSRALLKEVGDGVSLEEAVDEGRKGRAQTIVILKNKVKRLELTASQGGSIATMQTGISRSTRGPDVDAQAEEEIEYMSSARKIAVEELSEAHAKLEERHKALADKHSGVRARVRTLEAEASQHKQQMRIVIDKSETDDQLVNALKSEITRLKTVGARGSNPATIQANEAMEARLKKATKEATSAATANMDNEVTRLRRLSKQQAEQLATQESLIKELRSHGGSRY